MTIGERIKNRRIELGLSVDTIAAKLNKNRATIYRYESDDIENLPTTVLEPLAEVLQTTPAYLMGWDEENDNQDKPIGGMYLRLAREAQDLGLDEDDIDTIITLYKKHKKRNG